MNAKNAAAESVAKVGLSRPFPLTLMKLWELASQQQLSAVSYLNYWRNTVWDGDQSW